MKKNHLFKLAALAMAGAMAIAPLPVSAAEVDSEDAAQGTTTGTGDVEGIVNKDVFKVELPTIAAGDTTFNFILDPQGLIKDTDGAAHTGATFDENAKGLYFANPQSDSTVKYMASSPALTAKNKGTLDVDVTLSAAANALSDTGYSIGLAPDDTFAGDKATNVYLALVSGDQTVALTDEGATITDTLDAAPADAYEVTYDTTDSKYKYGLTTAAQAADYAGFDSLNFNMTGACNTAADWAAAEAAAPTVDVAWTLERHYVVPESDCSAAITINYKGTDPTAGSLVFTKPDGTTWTPPASAYTSNILINTTNKTLTLTSAWLNSAKENFGKGTYSVAINGKDYALVIIDPLPKSDTTTPISLTYTGADPAADGSLVFTKPDGTTWTPPVAVYDANNIVIDSTNKTVTFEAAWLGTVKSNFGAGTYAIEINSVKYKFIIQ